MGPGVFLLRRATGPAEMLPTQSRLTHLPAKVWQSSLKTCSEFSLSPQFQCSPAIWHFALATTPTTKMDLEAQFLSCQPLKRDVSQREQKCEGGGGAGSGEWAVERSSRNPTQLL